MTAFHWFTIAACFASIMFTLLNTRRLWRQARQRERDESARWLESESRREIEKTPRPLGLFAPCPYCGTPAYHLLSAPRQHVEDKAAWALGVATIWNTTGTYRVSDRVARSEAVKQMFTTTVIDRECLSCGKTWMETP